MSIGPWQLILILALALIFFGPGRLPGLGKSLGEAIRGFKKGITEDDEIDVSQNNQIRDGEKQNHTQSEKKKEESKT